MTTDIYLAIFFILPIIISIYTYSSFNGKLSKQEDIIKSQQRVLRNYKNPNDNINMDVNNAITEMDSKYSKKLNEYELVFDTLFFKCNNLKTENDKILKIVESNQNLFKKAEKQISKNLPSLEEINKVFKNYSYNIARQKKLLKSLGSTQLYAINKHIYVVNVPKKYENVVSSIGLKKCDFKNPATGKLETNAWFVTNDYFTKESLSATLVQIFKTI
ncbi:hypothetical protein EDM00_09450 [Ornithobacterium rhinotracheale]|uniref:hypothetical protein n=1 Tax=Ornithobacterium rhinotracheale TaxID=28251 RepID=UPI00129C2209|nr:hypothetical protein [Ornithobacterium rhinotracheale]MRI64212.1 hypothetical protein [Ornithobacterium rhinotracheale]